MTMSTRDSGPWTDGVPFFDRVHYFFGQMLGVREFRLEQDFFREKMKLQNRCLHGYGTVCGLEVEPGPPAGSPCDSKTEVTKTPTWVRVRPGLALDCDGNELVVRGDFTLDVWSLLSSADRQKVKDDAGGASGTSIWISLCYEQCPLEPVRPVVADTCGAPRDCQYALWRDGLVVRATLAPPVSDDRCEPCCEACKEACLVLARIDGFQQGKQLVPGDIDNSIRRLLSLRTPTRIRGVNWTTGATYAQSDTDKLLGADDDGTPNQGGLVIEFTRPVKVATLMLQGIVDLWVVRIGRSGGASGEIQNWEGAFVGLPPLDKGDETVQRATFRSLAGEEMQPGDRLLVTVRTDFILDACCRPVDGDNVGGRVPVLADFAAFDRSAEVNPKGVCSAPNPYGPWTSGGGNGSASFQSWFYCKKDPPTPNPAPPPPAKASSQPT